MLSPLAWEKWYADEEYFWYIKMQISLGWHLPSTVDVSCLLKKLKRKNAETEHETSASTPNFSKKGLGTRIPKSLTCEFFPHQLMRVKSSMPIFLEMFTSGLFTSGIFKSVIYIIGIYIRFSWSSCRDSHFICIWSCFIGGC